MQMLQNIARNSILPSLSRRYIIMHTLPLITILFIHTLCLKTYHYMAFLRNYHRVVRCWRLMNEIVRGDDNDVKICRQLENIFATV